MEYFFVRGEACRRPHEGRAETLQCNTWTLIIMIICILNCMLSTQILKEEREDQSHSDVMHSCSQILQLKLLEREHFIINRLCHQIKAILKLGSLSVSYSCQNDTSQQNLQISMINLISYNGHCLPCIAYLLINFSDFVMACYSSKVSR